MRFLPNTHTLQLPPTRWLERGGAPALVAVLIFALSVTAVAGPAAESVLPAQLGSDFFERRIRPVLVERCYKCHSGIPDKPRGGLRLDTPSFTRRGGDSGVVIVPGKPEASLLLAALRHESLKMPPDERLPQHVVADFAAWIRAGATDPRREASVALGDRQAIGEASRRHWAFQPIARPELPDVSVEGRPRGPIDRFVLHRLEHRGLSLTRPADRRTLIRRAYFDLLGLPPSPQAVKRFVADGVPDSFRRLVDRLLASPHYGERWGRHWLDVARYADNKGYVFYFEKTFPWAYTYRDYVVRAFNEDKPFDRFVLEQLAADQLDLEGDRSPLAAMGFLTVGPRFTNNTHDIMDDRIDVVSRGLLGLTFSCARCHDHKYDPLPQADYYSLYGVFRSSHEPLVLPEFESPAETQQYANFHRGLDERQSKLELFLKQQREMIMVGSRQRVAEYLLAAHARRHHPNTEDFMLLTEKGSLIPLMVLRWEQYLRRMRRVGNPIWTLWHAVAELSEDNFSEHASRVCRQLDKSTVHPKIRAAFEGDAPSSMKEIAERYAGVLLGVRRRWEEALAAIERTGASPPERLEDALDEELRQVLYGLDSPSQLPQEFDWGFLQLLPDRPTQAEFQKLLKDVEQWTMKEPGAPARAMVLKDKAEAYEPFVFVRGNPNRRGEVVPRRLPKVLSPERRESFGQESGRLALARAIVAPTNPLTARVLVNRIWQHHFGSGLVETPSDFGLRSREPSHPQLLDWLASELVDSGWSIKHLHRQIMSSAVYLQGAGGESRRDGAGVTDPENRLLWSSPRRRLHFESMRDSLLSVAGQLIPRVGGPPARQENGLVPRRSLYGFVDRLDVPPVWRTFDFPNPAASSAGRSQTTVPPQGLYFLNSDFVYECASGVLGRAEIASAGTTRDRIGKIFWLLFARAPDAGEMELAVEYIDAAKPGGDEQATTERWIHLVHGLLMTNEFVFID